MRKLVLVFLICLTAAGCASLRQLLAGAFQKPTVRFKNATLQNASLSDATMNLVWELENPNPIGLTLAGLDYKFSVEGKQVVAGTPPTGMNIAASGSSDLTFPANIKFADIVPVIQTFLTKDHAAYRAEGMLGFKTPIGNIRLPLSYDGQFEVPKIPKIEMAPPRITNLGLTSATVEFPLSVTNQNTYALPIKALAGSIQIAGANVGQISTGNLGDLSPKSARQVTVPLTIHFAQATQAALALRNGSATVAFNGKVDSGATSIPIQFQQTLRFQR
jgi:LEA14-like dessication related protein